jgi:hypothetical protein
MPVERKFFPELGRVFSGRPTENPFLHFCEGAYQLGRRSKRHLLRFALPEPEELKLCRLDLLCRKDESRQ